MGAKSTQDEFLNAGSNFLNNAEDCAEFRLTPVATLEGRTITVAAEHERVVYKFAEGKASRTVDGKTVTLPYEAFEFAPDVFFIPMRIADDSIIDLVADYKRGVVSTLSATLPPKAAPGVQVRIALTPGILVEAGNGSPDKFHPPARSLAGHRTSNRYGEDIIYEHIFLNDNYITWLGVEGPQTGQASTEKYISCEIEPGVYLVAMAEHILSINMTFAINLNTLQSTGTVFARDQKSGEPIFNSLGARITVLHTAAQLYGKK